MKNNTLAALSICTLLISGNAIASTFDSSALQNIVDDVTVTTPTCSVAPCASSFDVSSDYINNDEYWSVTGSGGSVATMIIDIAGTSDLSFGIYDRFDASRRAALFNSANNNGDQATLRILSDGRVITTFFDPDTYATTGGFTGVAFTSNQFGYYIDDNNGTIVYSDADLNADGEDHLKTYQGNDADMIQISDYSAGLFTDNEFIMAWETSHISPNSDFSDFVIIVESVIPVSEPFSIGLLGLGLAALGFRSRRKK